MAAGIIGRHLWKIVNRDGREIVKALCPGCHVWGALDHTIDPDGTVRPSVDCEKCDFHEFVRLDGWEKKESFTSVP